MTADSSSNEADKQPADPGFKAVRDYLMYGVTLPERALRSTVAVVGGTLRESAALLVPGAFRSSKTYSIFVEQMLDFMVTDLGGVEDATREGAPGKVDDYVARKAVGNFVELAGMATIHLSPMTMLAIISDVAYGSQVYLSELSSELKQRGVIDKDTTIDRATDLLDAVGKASSKTADTFDTPPLSVDGLRNAIEQTTEAVTKIDPVSILPQAELTRMWSDMQSLAAREQMGMLEVSGAVTMHALDRVGAVGDGALSTLTVAGGLFEAHIIDHYREALDEINEKGVYASLARTSKPYIEAVWLNFSTGKSTLTQDILSGKFFTDTWSTVQQYLVGSKPVGGGEDGND